MTNDEQIEALIAAGKEIPQGECEITEGEFSSPNFVYIGEQQIMGLIHDNGYGDDFAHFIAQAANAREAIKAMYDENKRLKEAIQKMKIDLKLIRMICRTAIDP